MALKTYAFFFIMDIMVTIDKEMIKPIRYQVCSEITIPQKCTHHYSEILNY